MQHYENSTSEIDMLTRRKCFKYDNKIDRGEKSQKDSQKVIIEDRIEQFTFNISQNFPTSREHFNYNYSIHVSEWNYREIEDIGE